MAELHHARSISFGEARTATGSLKQMSRRLEIELTSERPDGTWTWRKAGAREPKGEMTATVLPSGCKVGDVLRAEAEFLLDGIEILSIVPPKSARKEPELLTVLGSGRSEPAVTTQLIERKGRGDRKERRDRGERGERRGDRRDPDATLPAAAIDAPVVPVPTRCRNDRSRSACVPVAPIEPRCSKRSRRRCARSPSRC